MAGTVEDLGDVTLSNTHKVTITGLTFQPLTMQTTK